jgi:hypothetical protein
MQKFWRKLEGRLFMLTKQSNQQLLYLGGKVPFQDLLKESCPKFREEQQKEPTITYKLLQN